MNALEKILIERYNFNQHKLSRINKHYHEIPFGWNAQIHVTKKVETLDELFNEHTLGSKINLL